MAKEKEQWVCTACGGVSYKWLGQCPHCGQWNTLVEEISKTPRPKASKEIIFLNEVHASEQKRLGTGIAEFDRVLGGGLVPASVILLGGDPGIGKSTLLLQALAMLAKNHRVLYVSAEESAEQVASRASRLSLAEKNLPILPETELETILGTLESHRPEIAVVDSIQTIYTPHIASGAGSVSQVRACAATLVRLAKERNFVLFLVGHVTKEGQLAGPRVLEHLVDTVLYFEGETTSNLRLVRAFKNRFGSINELGVFAMSDKGLKEVANPSLLFISRYDVKTPGKCVFVAVEGTRPLLVEVQSLADTAHGPPRRLTVGLEPQRFLMLLAVLARHGNLTTYDKDIFANVVGGLKITEPASDLAVLLAVVSSLWGKALPAKLAVFGEIGLTGEVRPVARGQERIKEAVRSGFTDIILPFENAPKKPAGIRVHPVAHVAETINRLAELTD
jgi:DNA repair protein RadA/Sms